MFQELKKAIDDRIGVEKVEEIDAFRTGTEVMLKTHPTIQMTLMLGAMGIAASDDPMKAINELNTACIIAGAAMYRESLSKVAPELVEKVDAHFMEKEE
jgi:hypothetical protein